MRARFVVPLLLVFLVASGSAEARPRGRVVYSLVMSALGLFQSACFGTATYLRLSAPNADTLMTFKREASIEDGLFFACGILTVPFLAFAVGGGIGLLRDTDHRTAQRDDDRPATRLLPSLMVTGNGAGLGIGGRF